MKTFTLLAALVALPAAAFAQAAAPGGTDVYDMPCSSFHHNADGSWNAAVPMTLQPAAGPLTLKPDVKFKPGTPVGGFDLAAALDKACPH